MKSIYILTILIFISKFSIAQTSDIRHLSVEKKQFYTNTNPLAISSISKKNVSFEILDRETKKGDFIMLENKTKKLPQKGKVPGIFWGIGGGLLYIGGNKLLFGGTDNVSPIGIIVSFATGTIIGTIVNQSKSNKRSTTKKYY